MRVGIIAESLAERLALALGKVPEPIVDAFPPLVLARSIMAASRLGIFHALDDCPLTASQVAARCGTDPRATVALLDVLTSAGYVTERRGAYRLASKMRRWLDHESASEVDAYLRFNYLQWTWLDNLEVFLRSGTPVAFHGKLSAAEWKFYERGMVALARLTLPEVIWRVRLPRDASTLLDLGGGHGLAAASFCQRYPVLRATVLDLPSALDAAPQLPAALASVEPRMSRVAGDALTADLGREAYDVIYVANLVHHFDAADNEALARRIAAALRPGGLWVIQDGIREHARRSQRMPAAIGNLYFALTSASGFWSFEEMAGWQQHAGLQPRRGIHLLTAPGQGLQIGIKPRAGGQRP